MCEVLEGVLVGDTSTEPAGARVIDPEVGGAVIGAALVGGSLAGRRFVRGLTSDCRPAAGVPSST
jgi:hypothetical protein